MKKTLLTLAAVIFTVVSMNAQDLYLSYEGETLGDTVTFWGDPSDAEIVAHAVLHNNTSTDMQILVRRKQLEMVDGSQSQFCWGLCFPPHIEESPDPILLLGGEQSADDAFSGHYNPSNNIGTSVVEYTFFNQANEDQNVTVVVKYWASPEGIAEDAMIGGSISNVYPNPATNQVSIDYELTSKVDHAQARIVNLLGAVVKEVDLEHNANKLTMDISDLAGGIYFYAVMVNGDVYNTKKLVIQK